MSATSLLPHSVFAASTPSRKDGISTHTEMKHRIMGCQFIQEAVILLKLPQVVAVTGQNILNRFYYRCTSHELLTPVNPWSLMLLFCRKSLQRFDVFTVAMGSVLLASKVEENFKTLREVLYHHVYFV